MDLAFVARALSPATLRGSGRVDPVERRASDESKALDGRDGGTLKRTEGSSGITVELSDRAAALLQGSELKQPTDAREAGGEPTGESEDASASSGEGRPGELTAEEQEEVQRLAARDAEVRAHENAHKAAAGRHARGGPTYELTQGPDGKRYAVGGEVSIDTSAVPNDPDATILKMQQVRRAAQAPAEPSGQDRRVAAEASRTESAARAEKLEAKREEQSETRSPGASAYAMPQEDRRGETLNLTA